MAAAGLPDEFTEIESGANSDRPELAKALRACELKGATLLIANIDRLSRDAHFLLGLSREGVEFTAMDMPQANRLTAGIMAMVADEDLLGRVDRVKRKGRQRICPT